MYCAWLTPSAAWRSHWAACCSSRSTPTPLARHSPRLKDATRSPEAAACSNQRATLAGSSGLPAPSPVEGPLIQDILAAYEDPGCVEDLGALNRWPGRSGVPVEEYLRLWKV